MKLHYNYGARCCAIISANSMWINWPKNHLVSTYLLTRQKKKKNVSNPFFSCAAENHLTNERFASLSQKVIEQSSKKNLRKRQPNCKSCQEFNKIIVKFTPKKYNIIKQRKHVKKCFNNTLEQIEKHQMINFASYVSILLWNKSNFLNSKKGGRREKNCTNSNNEGQKHKEF